MPRVRPTSGRGDNAPFGCAGILLLLAGVLAFGGYNNHQWWRQRQEQIPRFKPVRATVDDKGIARYDSRDNRGSTKTEYKKWIRFTCRLGDAGDKDGARLTLSGSDVGWESFQKGQDYDAYYDPVVNECVLLIDEKVGEPDHDLLFFLFLARLFGGAAVLVAVIGVVVKIRRRRPVPRPD